MCSAARNASTKYVIAGCPRPPVTNEPPSTTKRFGTSWARWLLFTTARAGAFPMRQVPQQVESGAGVIAHPLRRRGRRTCRPEHAVIPVAHVLLEADVVRMVLEGHADRRQAPCVFHFVVERNAVLFNSERCRMPKADHGVVELLFQAAPVLASPTGRSRRRLRRERNRWYREPEVDAASPNEA